MKKLSINQSSLLYRNMKRLLKTNWQLWESSLSCCF